MTSDSREKLPDGRQGDVPVEAVPFNHDEEVVALVSEDPFARLLEELNQEEQTTEEKLRLTTQIMDELRRRFPNANPEHVNGLFYLLVETHRENMGKGQWTEWARNEGSGIISGTLGFVGDVVTFKRPLLSVAFYGALAWLAARYWGWIADTMPVPDPSKPARDVADEGIPLTPGSTVPDMSTIPRTLRPRE